jgi:large subunit ribosomal protein L31
MKPEIHPKCKAVEIKFPQGDSLSTISAYSGNEIFLDIDFRKHPAWTGQNKTLANDSNAKVVGFDSKYGRSLFTLPKKS